MKVKTRELARAALDWAVAQCEHNVGWEMSGEDRDYYSTDWARGGPIIEREGIDVRKLIAQKFHRYEYTDQRMAELGGVVEVRHSPRGPSRWLVTPCKPHSMDGKFLARRSEGTGATVVWRKEDFLSDTALVAAMRCHVAFYMGDQVDIPDELLA